MIRTLLILVIVVVLGYLGFAAYQARSEKAKVDRGDYTCQGCDTPEQHARFLKENSGDSMSGSRRAREVQGTVQGAVQGAGQGTVQEDPSTDASGRVPAQSTMVEPAAAVVVPATSDAGATIAGVPPAGMPVTDTLAPNPPNGMTFTGRGTYQWYRQGNLTWRVDTTTGQSCVIYATLAEWRKAIVKSHACGRSS